MYYHHNQTIHNYHIHRKNLHLALSFTVIILVGKIMKQFGILIAWLKRIYLEEIFPTKATLLIHNKSRTRYFIFALCVFTPMFMANLFSHFIPNKYNITPNPNAWNICLNQSGASNSAHRAGHPKKTKRPIHNSLFIYNSKM